MLLTCGVALGAAAGERELEREPADPDAVAEVLAAREESDRRGVSGRAYLHYLRGMLAMREGDLEEAEKELRKARLHDRDSSSLWFALVEVRLLMSEQLLERGDHRRAVTVLRSLSETEPEDARVSVALAQALMQAGRAVEAGSVLEQIQVCSIEDPSVLERLGDVLAAAGRFKSAVEAYMRALDLTEEHSLERRGSIERKIEALPD